MQTERERLDKGMHWSAKNIHKFILRWCIINLGILIRNEAFMVIAIF